MPREKWRHVDDPVAVGQRIKAARERVRLPQRQLAFPGCTPAYVSRIEAGARVPSMQILQEFARRLGVTPEYLATGKETSSGPVDALDDADLAARLDDLDGAEARYLEIVGDDSASRYRLARAYAGLGDVALRRGDHQRAVERLEKALSLDVLAPDQTAAAVDRLGRAYALLGEYDMEFSLY